MKLNYVAVLSSSEFKRRYRMDEVTFDSIVMKIREDVKDTHTGNLRSHNGEISPEIKLSMALRFLAGGSYLDIADLHGVRFVTYSRYHVEHSMESFVGQ